MTSEQARADSERAAEIYFGPILRAAERYRAANGPDAAYTLRMPEDGLPAFWLELRDLCAKNRIGVATYPSTCTNPR